MFPFVNSRARARVHNCLQASIRLIPTLITFSPKDLLVSLQAQKQEQNHLSVPKILKAVELKILRNCLLYFSTSPPNKDSRNEVGPDCAG